MEGNSRFEFTASLVDGPYDIDLVKEASLQLSEADEKRLWNKTNWQSLLDECPSVNLVAKEEVDEMPGQSDVFYSYVAESREQLKVDLRRAISAVLDLK